MPMKTEKWMMSEGWPVGKTVNNIQGSKVWSDLCAVKDCQSLVQIPGDYCHYHKIIKEMDKAVYKSQTIKQYNALLLSFVLGSFFGFVLSHLWNLSRMTNQ